MRAEEHRELRLSLGAYALGDLSPGERAAVEGHLRECAECRAEAEALVSVGRLLPLADPARFSEPAPRPPAELGERVAATIGAERRAERSQRRRRRGFGFALAGATAAAALVLALVVFNGDGGGEDPATHVEFSSLPGKVEISAKLVPHAYGTEIHMYVKGARSGTLCQVFLRDQQGRRFSAGSFRYRWGDDSNAVLSSALDLSRTKSIAVNAGGHTYVAPVGQGPSAAIWNPTEEDA
ncbi:MAG TPA: zf-HC2 domain-containing protein [Solirubrobacterales bacterium]|nr:zf-HC2 domain-containing protein [Solirubrobacterales bacterium]